MLLIGWKRLQKNLCKAWTPPVQSQPDCVLTEENSQLSPLPFSLCAKQHGMHGIAAKRKPLLFKKTQSPLKKAVCLVCLIGFSSSLCKNLKIFEVVYAKL